MTNAVSMSAHECYEDGLDFFNLNMPYPHIFLIGYFVIRHFPYVSAHRRLQPAACH